MIDNQSLMKEKTEGRKIGYARVSTDEQNLDMQLDALKDFGCDAIWQDHASAAARKRKGLDNALLDCEEGDTFVVWKLDRLARRIKDILHHLEMFQNQGVGFVSLRDNIDTTSASGKLMLHMLAAMAEFERDQIIERTRAGMKAAKARGKKVGNEQKMTAKMVEDAQYMRDRRMTARQIADRLHKRYRIRMSPKSVYNYTVAKGSKRKPRRTVEQ